MAFEPDVGFRVVDKLTGSAKSMHLSGFRWTEGLDWSPASNLLAILTTLENGRYAIWTVHPDGSQQRKVIEENELASPRWSPAGDGIYFLRTSQGHTQDLLKVAINPKSGQAKDPASVLLSGLQAGDYFTVSTDGTRLAYSRSQDYSNLWLAQFQSPDNGMEPGKGLQTTPLTRGTSKFDSPSISPDGKWIAFVTEGHIYKMAIEGGTPVQLTFSNATEFSPAWSSDGKRIVFGSNEGGTYKVWIVDADGADRRQFAKTQLSSNGDGPITWSPGRHILYQKPGNQNFNILDPETGEEKPLVQNERAGWIFSPKYSSDGKNVAVQWNRWQRGLWVISLIDNSQTFLSGSRYYYPAGWSPDGSSIYAYDRFGGNKMLSIPVGPTGRGASHTVFAIPEEIAAASVSADGKKFVYSAAETKSDVWVVDNFDPAYRK
jgi:Tol biopolymer transport system component